jgi:pimeloyl-ACP methyl ester carboxylesterase
MRTTIENRKGQRMAVLLEIAPDRKKLAFVMHGLGGFKEQPHTRVFADVLLDAGYSVVSFDTTNSFGESEGNYEDATFTNYYEDLEDVLEWSEGQSWYQEPFVLVGHSLGAMSVALFAEKYPAKVRALAPISTVVSGQLSLQAPRYTPAILKEWKETGWLSKPSMSKPGVMKRLKWSHMEDRLRFDLLPKAQMLTMPVILIVGSEDTSTPPGHQQRLYEVLPGKKELRIIEGSDHCFRDERSLTELKRVFASWVASLP